MNIRPFTFACARPGRPLDACLGSQRGALHEVVAAGADFPAGLGFGLAAAARLAEGRATLWICDDASGTEAGSPYGAGLVEFGLDPLAFLIARVRTETQALQAALEGARCAGLGAVLLELNGAARSFDLTASRRLALACEVSGTSLVAIRIGGEGRPSAALARWRASPAPSCALAARAPGAPAFLVRLERHRGGEPERVWRVEWDREATVLRSVEIEATLSESVGAVSGGGGAAAGRAAR